MEKDGCLRGHRSSPETNTEDVCNSVLLFRLGGLGDLLVLLPSLIFLRKKLRSGFFTLVCRKEYGELLRETGIVDRIEDVSQRRLSPLFLDQVTPGPDLDDWIKGHSLILGWMQKERGFPLEHYCTSRLKGKCRFFLWDEGSLLSVSRYFYEKTAAFFSPEGGPDPRFEECLHLPLSQKQKDKGLQLLGWSRLKTTSGIAVVHPGSGSEKKCWSLENFLEIVNRLSKFNCKGALVTGPADEWISERLKNLTLPSGWFWLHGPPLTSLAGLLSECRIFLGNDSGVTHLAAACGTRVVALFRKEFEPKWRPNGRVTLLTADALDHVKLDSVWEAVARQLSP